jgi:hypothetical protein
MAEELNRSEVIARRFELDEQITIIQGRHKAELAPLQEELVLCERFVADSMIQSGEQSVKIENGNMTYFTTQDSVKMGNWDEFIAYVQATGDFELLNHAANKTHVKEIIETINAPPPGVSYESRKVLAWRRGKA